MHHGNSFDLEWAIYVTGDRWDFYEDLNVKDHCHPRKVKALKYLREFRDKMETEKQELNEKIKHWMARAQAFEQDKNFLQN